MKKALQPRALYDQRGIALVTALIISLVVFLLIGSTLYFITQSTVMSGAGKKYATAAEAADGAVDAVKDAINQVWWANPMPSLFPTGNCTDKSYDLSLAIRTQNNPCAFQIDLSGTGLGTYYTADITFENLYSLDLPGGRLEFARAAGGVYTRAIFYRITVTVTGKDGTKAENAAMYRFTS